MKTFRFKHFSLTVSHMLVLAFVISTVVGTDAILTTIDNIRNAAPWWHTAFTAVESVVFLTTTVCCILRALQPGCSGRGQERVHAGQQGAHGQLSGVPGRRGALQFSEACESGESSEAVRTV